MADYTLALDGSTYAGSVALIHGREVIGERALPDSGIPGRGHRGEDFMPMVVECLSSSCVQPRCLARVVCGAGPGSFTSLRIAASIAKGIAVGAGCPLFSVSSLILIAASSDLGEGAYIAALSAMRGDSFALEVTVDSAGHVTSAGSHSIVPTAAIVERGSNSGTQIIGPGFGAGLRPHARSVAKLLDRILESGPVDLESWEPDYGRLAEAQVKWETAHGRALAAEQ